MRSTLLVLIAAGLAFARPVEVFLLAFTVLGPLHYLTELAWLHRRGYFVADPRGGALLATLALAGVGLSGAVGSLAPPANAEVQLAAVVAMWLAVVAAGVLGLTSGPRRGPLALALIGAAAVGVALGHSAFAFPFFLAFGVFLPTVVHVFGFTAIFMLHGCRRRGAREDLAAATAFLVCAAVAVAPIGPLSPPSVAAEAAYTESFAFLNRALLGLLGQPSDGAHALFERPVAAGVMRLLAFAYLHHYLNWFEKTDRIGWARLPTPQLLGILVAWLACLGLYAWDLELGLAVVMVPNLLHVVLELPLDWRITSELFSPSPARGA